MFKWVVFFTLVVGSYGASIRIVNGTDAVQGEFPFAVSLRRGVSHTCGATILNANRVLTAAHCCCLNNGVPQDASLFTVQYGSVQISATTARSIQVSRINCHNYNANSITNDVAVLELATSLPNDGSWSPVTLGRNFNTNTQHTGVIIGWGRLWANGPIPSTLQKLTVQTYTDSVCSRYDPSQHVCFGAPIGGACNGDSGTSLLVNGQQVGIASFITTTCGTASTQFPNVYAKVTAFLNFIDQHS